MDQHVQHKSDEGLIARLPTHHRAIHDLKNSMAWQCLKDASYHPGIVHTPIVRSHVLGQAAGISDVYFKAEYLQTGNSFKIRGALHKLRSLETPIVFTASAGNHGIGLALAARILGMKAVIHVPSNTPEIKKKKINAASGTLVVGGKDFNECEMLAMANCERQHGEFISSFDDDHIISGNGGSLAREIESAFSGDLGADILCPIGGGGLASGLCAYFYGSDTRVFGVEPAVDCAMHKSLRAGSYQSDYLGDGSIADGLSGSISPRTFELCRAGLHQSLVVSESEILDAIAWAYDHMGIVIEGSSAAVIAALLNKRNVFSPRVFLILTGANIDQATIDLARKHTNKPV